MATTTGPRKGTAGRARSGSGTAPTGRARAAAPAKAPARGRGAPPARRRSAGKAPRGPARGPRAGRVRLTLGGHGHDVAGLALLAGALVAALGIYADLAGPAGRALSRGAATAVGRGRLVLPLAVAALGLVLLVRRPREDAGRLVVGAGLLTVSGGGLLHLLGGSPSMDSPLDELRGAGGVLGGALTEPLRAVLATGGAGVVLLAVG
ncbi:MAG TPA: hypothetical protein VG455_16730, partial [Acidimicrobiales bacterium]|nr:hypothetical protein [Acidimicrobiales bacterium]